MTLGGRGFNGRRARVNRIRGNIMESLTNSAVDARSYPLNTASSPLLSAYREQFGIGVGGPLYIPKIYNGADKTSFFVNYQLQRSKSAFDSYSTVPTSDERVGDFSAAPTIYMPGLARRSPGTRFLRRCSILRPSPC